MSKEQELWKACSSGNLDLVKSLSNDPAVNFNWVGPEKGDTSLHRACYFAIFMLWRSLSSIQT